MQPKSKLPDGSYQYQSLIQTRLPELSTSEQAVAAHLAAHPEQLPFETAQTLAKRLGVSAMTVGRTLKALGYRGLGQLRAEMRFEVPEGSAPWTKRGASPTLPALKSEERLRALRAEVEAIEAVYALSETPAWAEAVVKIASARQVFVAGFGDERGLAILFCDHLGYVRSGVRYLSIENRAFVELAEEAGPDICLVLIDTRRYSRWFRMLAQRSVGLGVPVVIATDAYCRWAARLTPHVLQARTDSGQFWDNHAPISSLLNLLTEDVIDRLGDAVHSHLNVASEYKASFMGFDREQRERNKKASTEKEPARSRSQTSSRDSTRGRG
jgi:DNA-binding MurR/RpiR family transcriptional regulator